MPQSKSCCSIVYFFVCEIIEYIGKENSEIRIDY